jgi:hypothetical protein
MKELRAHRMPRTSFLMLVLTMLALTTRVGSASPVVIILDTWESAAFPVATPVPTPAEPGPLDVLADLREFTLEDHGPGELRVHIDWDPAVLEDLDLYVDRQDSSADWELVAYSAAGDTMGSEDNSAETVLVQNPEPGRYRARVMNRLSIESAYAGEAWYQTTG